MGYLNIDNLYKAQEVLMFRECYAMEKIHGTSAQPCFSKIISKCLLFTLYMLKPIHQNKLTKHLQ